MKCTRGPRQRRDRATAQRFTCPCFNFAEAPIEISKLIRFGSLHFSDDWGWPLRLFVWYWFVKSCNDETATGSCALLCMQS